MHSIKITSRYDLGFGATICRWPTTFFVCTPVASLWQAMCVGHPHECADGATLLVPLLRSKNATGNITLLRTVAGPGGTGYDRCLHVSIVVRIVHKRGIEFVVIVAVDVVAAQGAAHARAK